MAVNNTNNFLPEIFRSDANKKFFSATLDQLTADAKNVIIDGYIGRTFAPTYKLGDNYIPELGLNRVRYQLEPSVVSKDKNSQVDFTSSYIDLLQGITNNSGFANSNHQRMFGAEYYNYDGRFNYDKFVNYYNYYWLPNGPESVNVYADQTPYQATWEVTKNKDEGGYTFSDMGSHANPQLTVARGGTYEFKLGQPGSKFWIQTEPGASGVETEIPTVTTREVFGVQNNGAETGIVRFNVPLESAQNFFLQMNIAKKTDGKTPATVDLAATFKYTDIQNRFLSDFLTEFPSGLDGVNSSLIGKTFAFINNDHDSSFWTTPALPSGWESYPLANTTEIVPGSIIPVEANPRTPLINRTNIWEIVLVPVPVINDFIIQIRPVAEVKKLEKIFIRSGRTRASNYFWLNNNHSYAKVPQITSNLDYLYYQDGTDGGFNGVIKIVDNKSTPINIDRDIIGSVGYKSPNGILFTNGLKVKFDSFVSPGDYADREYYVDGVGTSITLTPVDQLVITEPIGAYINTTPDYITINRSSKDRNTWSRYNRWFHKGAIEATAKYKQKEIDYGPNLPARRPIVEFEPDLKLFNYGEQELIIVDIVDFLAQRDAFVDVEGKGIVTVNGVTLSGANQGQLVIFANDFDTNIRDKIWKVVVERINNSNFITLIDTGIKATPGLNVLATQGDNKGIPFYYNGTNWIQAQVKTTVNQPPLFDLLDASGYSFSDTTVYPNSTFAGTRFFGYAEGTGKHDSILTNLRLKYQNFNSIGDIVFDNYYDTDSFTYTNYLTQETINCNSGYLSKNGTLVNNWVVGKEKTQQYQVFTKLYNGLIIKDEVDKEYAFVQVDVLPTGQTTIPYIKVYLNNKLLATTEYKLMEYGAGRHIVRLNTLPTVGDKIDVLVYSNTPSPSGNGYYQIPTNLDLNPLNEKITSISLGQIRNHYYKLIENTSGNKPLQDSYLKAQGGTLVQHGAPVIYGMAFLNHPTLNFSDGINLARREYARFKNKFLSLCHTLTDLDYNDPISGVDKILQNINAVKNSSFPWYYSDMVPYSGNYSTINYTVLDERKTNYEINGIFNNTQLSNRAVLIYRNEEQLIADVDYTFSQLSPTVIFSQPFKYGDKLVIKDYASTDGNYIPETPTKLGLFPKYTPTVYRDDTYQTPTNMIRGHDGSLTPSFGDFRDQYLLELEKRIYNNIKVNNNNNVIDFYDLVPGKFRTTDYSYNAYLHLLSRHFLQWIGQNNLDYTSNNWFDANNPWTWNYGSVRDIITNSGLTGSWRSIYNHWFDTVTPNLTPWEMIGFGSMPTWWEDRYGPAPYTSGNGTLWQDLETGYVWNSGDPYIDKRFARPGLTNFIPVDNAGNLLNPTQIPLTGSSIGATASSNFQFGQHGPVETAWRRSSDFPFVAQLALATAKPAEYFATQIDPSRFFVNPTTGQFSDVDNNKISPALLIVNGDTTSGAVRRSSGYLNWIADNVKSYGIDPVETFNNFIKGLDVNLTYKLGGFADKNLISVTAEQTSPNSNSSSVVIPDENYKIYLNKSVPTTSVGYSAVIVERTANGYTVSGYDTANPFFTVLPDLANNDFRTIKVNDKVAKLYNKSVANGSYVTIPYGTEFTSIQQTVSFLIGYERYLKNLGFYFEQIDSDLGEIRDWSLSAKEFLYWSQQGWVEGALIILNPTSTQLTIKSILTTVGEIENTVNGSKILNQNYLPIKSNEFNILRETAEDVNNTKITTVNGSMICFARLNLVQTEHVLVFDNVTDFNDIIYLPHLGNRQYRLKLNGSRTGSWNGSFSATGYIYSDPDINDWSVDKDYLTGDLVTFNSSYYAAKADIPAATTFDLGKWTLIPAENIKQGLLPSLGHNAQKFLQFYDVDSPPAEEDLQLFSSGLIGFRQRPYLSNLGITIPNQTKFYQGYIKQKGTINAINALTKGSFDNVQGNIDTYEEWAFQVGRYGDLSNNQFVEFILNQSEFINTPLTLNLTETYNNSNVIVGVSGGNIYNANDFTITSLYQNRTDSDYPGDLPNAGYVNVDDVETQIFDITTTTPETILNVGRGHRIWTTKDGNNHWNVFRVNETGLTATTLSYSLDDLATITFDYRHPFNEGDLFILGQFQSPFNDYNGLYKVIRVVNSTQVTIRITGEFTKLRYLIGASPIKSQGIVYSLGPMVIDSLSEIDLITPQTDWIDGDRVWVNNATPNGWGVYTFRKPWLSNAAVKITANTITANSKFGTSTRISSDSQYIYVGNPGAAQVQIFANVGGNYQANVTITDPNAKPKFGSVIESKGNVLVVGSENHIHVYRHVNGAITQLQTNTFSRVTSIALSADTNWLYVGGNNRVTTYQFKNNVYVQTCSNVGTTSFGNVVKTNANGTTVFISAPEADDTVTQNGLAYVYTRSANANVITQGNVLHSQQKNKYSHFGADLDIDGTGGNLFIGIPGSIASGAQNGLVERYTLTNGYYAFNEALIHPDRQGGAFGSTISVSADAKVLAIGAEGAPSKEPTTFDQFGTETVIDSGLTLFVDKIINAGAAYIFEPQIDQVSNTAGIYTYVQDLETQVHSWDRFGSSIDVTRNVIVLGSPGGKSAHIFKNPRGSTVWTLTRSQLPKVDINNVSRTFMYNKNTNNILAALDFVDPNKGKILNTADKDIDFKTTKDPALYSNGTVQLHAEMAWGPRQVGQIWWNLDTVRYIDYEQDSLIYRLNHWGEQFPGSSIDVYQWTESTVLPSKYKDSGNRGTPLHEDDSAYSTYGYVDTIGNVKVKYYYWVKGLDTVADGKENSVISITNIISSPQSQGIPYATILSLTTITLQNVGSLLSGTNTVLHIGSRTVDAGEVHSEYALVQEGNPDSGIPAAILNKFIDSLSGVDRAGNQVPDVNLPVSQKYGIAGLIKGSPRQTMFVYAQQALDNYLSIINPILLAYPIVARKVLTTLKSNESIPAANSGAYDLSVSTVDELYYLDPTMLTVGSTNVLVTDDITQNNKWAIYQLTNINNSVGVFTLVRAQSFKTSLYWSYTDWYDSSYNSTNVPDVIVNNTLELGKQKLVPRTHIKVLNAGNRGFEVYYIDDNLELNLVGIENGTIQINTTPIPATELRQILTAIQNEVLIDDLANDYNRVFFSMIKYALTEQQNIEWAFKTSFLSAKQYIRKLEQFSSYVADNQNYYLDYINEVKPYRTTLREYVVNYIGNDTYDSDITDFDIPPYWEGNLNVYHSPTGTQPYDIAKWQSGVNSQWYANYKYSVVDVEVENPGTGFKTAPDVIIRGGDGTGAAGYAIVDGKGGVSQVIITNPGVGYTVPPTIEFRGMGTGAIGRALLKNVFDNNNKGHNLVRSIKTNMKFDRTTYTTSNTFVFWSNITSVNVGDILPLNSVIVLNDTSMLQITSNYTIPANLALPVSNVHSISTKEFSNANDRIASYSGNVNLAATQRGIERPHLLEGNSFVTGTFDAIVTSNYSTDFGVDPSDIGVLGGEYFDNVVTYAPEELIPGRMYDTLNMTVFDTNNLAFRVFDNMNQDKTFYRVTSANTTVLTSPLRLTDSNIQVADATVLPLPNRTLGIPGVVFINGEKIVYYRNYALEMPTPWVANVVYPTQTLLSYNSNVYLTTGNVFSRYFANIVANVTTINRNSLGQLRRGVDGTAIASDVYLSGTRVVDSSVQQQVPGTGINTEELVHDTNFTITNSVSYGLQLTKGITANIGDIVTQYDTTGTTVTLTMRVLESVVNSKSLAVILLTGSVASLPEVFDGPNGFDVEGFDNTTGTLFIQGINSQSYVLNAFILGNFRGIPEYANSQFLTGAGTKQIPAKSILEKTKVWYSSAYGRPSNGYGLINSTTDQARFLLASRGYTP
jgi:hypothetical protein